ncbi:helix-turn-helix domain-containing protein [Kitasatospora griseola]|uniref:helix-turn-helix domain-containing protein n=1 Tax=Kitasatospora griseola TaxID=2064 RepID=UPI00365AF10F
MGRRENPIEADEPALGRLAAWLREQREQAGLTYREIADRTNYHHTTLQRAAKGQRLPSWAVVKAIATACDADLKTARKKWSHAKYWAHVPRAPAGQPRRAPRRLNPDHVESFADLRRVMHEMRRKADWPSLEDLDERAKEAGDRLPPSTMALVLKGEAPLHKPVFTAFMRACRVKEHRIVLWQAAWERTNNARAHVPMTARTYQREFNRAMKNSAHSLPTEILFKLWVAMKTNAAADRRDNTAPPATSGHDGTQQPAPSA